MDIILEGFGVLVCRGLCPGTCLLPMPSGSSRVPEVMILPGGEAFMLMRRQTHSPTAGEIYGNQPIKALIFIAAFCCFFVCQGCCLECLTHEGYARKQRREQEAQFAPYQQRNTMEAYREFIEKYPGNMFVTTARYRIATFEFEPYEQADTMEGYMEFSMRYPGNPNVSRAAARIEQMEFKRYESMDTIEGYREFLVKYPDNPYSIIARDRLQDLEFRALDAVTRSRFGLDLLLYRLKVKRVLKDVQLLQEAPCGDPAIFVALDSAGGATYFRTHFIYGQNCPLGMPPQTDVREIFFRGIIVRLLPWLESHWQGKKELAGFSFDLAVSPARFYGDMSVLLEYSFAAGDVKLFAGKRLDAQELLSRASIMTAKKKAPEAEKQPAVNLDGSAIMAKVRDRDRGKDSIITRQWERVLKNGRADSSNSIEKRKSFGGEDGVICKTVTRYILPGFSSAAAGRAAAILMVSYAGRDKAFWYVMSRGDAGRTASIENYRPVAESDFSFHDYVDIDGGDEKHKRLGDEEYEGVGCLVVESIPVRDWLPYGRRINWIDGSTWTTLKTEYFDKQCRLWKILRTSWENRFGIRLWKEAVVENVQTGDRTTITTKDVRVNVGLPDSDFTPFALRRLTGR